MPIQSETIDNEAIHGVLRGVTAAWREGRFGDLRTLLRPDVVYVAPGFSGRLEDREACIESYREFLSAATVHEYTAEEPEVDLFADIAVATYRFEIDYSMAGARHREAGHDLFVLTRQDDGWRVAWRTLITAPERS